MTGTNSTSSRVYSASISGSARFRLDHSSDGAYWDSVDRVSSTLEEEARGDIGLDLLRQLAEAHPEWPVRAACVRLLGERFNGQAEAQETIAAATHDEVDWVAFTAIRTAGDFRIARAARDLIRISGWPSNFMRPGYARKPVGCGAAFTKRALVSIFGSVDPEELKRLEDEHFANVRERVEKLHRPRQNNDVAKVTTGKFVAGGSTQEIIDSFQMDDTDHPQRVAELPTFLIDRTAVTNARYEAFLKDAWNTTDFDHPDQEPNRDHMPAHWHDPRFNALDLPVVGVDWYDAWAFSRWAGGQLPSELEWEKAARGVDGRIFPWGNEWDISRANYAERAFGTRIGSLQELESFLASVTPTGFPCSPVMPADSLYEGESPYGAVHMSGNTWEMTRTNFYTGGDMDPFFKGRRPVEFMNRLEAFYVLRGGTWTSPPICLTTYYRGKDLLTDKHNEIGFRCVYSADPS